MRFVILHHITASEHFDIMFEQIDFLVTYSMDASLLDGFLQGNEVTLDRINNHRLLYLDYEGQISGERGWVKRFDTGTYSELEQNEYTSIYKIEGNKLEGLIEIVKRDKEHYTIRYKSSEKR